MPTYIDGVASSEAIDTAGEIVELAGLDCSSLLGGAINWEHKSDVPSQLVGKIVSYKKIFSEADAEDDRQKAYWNKVQLPFLYILARLFDDKKESSKEVAALFMDDAEHPDEPPMVGFSIEGAKISKDGMKISRSIARKVTVTNIPANKTCVAEMVPNGDTEKADDFDSIFKNEGVDVFKHASSPGLIALFKKEGPMKKATGVHSQYNVGSKNDGPGTSLAGQLVREDQTGDKASAILEHKKKLGELKSMPKPSLPKSEKTGTMKKDEVGLTMDPGGMTGGAPTSPGLNASEKNKKSLKKADVPKMGSVLGQTKTGKDVFSHGKVGEYSKFGSSDHKSAADLHFQAAKNAQNPKAREHHTGKMKLHMQAADTAERRESRGATKPPSTAGIHPSTSKNFVDIPGKDRGMNKALEAGSAMAAPSQLVQGAALGVESLEGKKQKKKSRWLALAEEQFSQWDKKEQFEKFMKSRMPHLTKGEIVAFGQAMILNKRQEMEKTLSGMAKALKFEHPAGHTPKEDATPKSKIPEKFKGKNPEFKGQFDAEVEHVEPHYSSDGPDAVYLSTGHVSNGHKAGKFKVGDKVTAKQHIQGTHILEHKKN